MATKLVKYCGKCGVELTSHGKSTGLCLSCYRVQPKSCKTCGKALDRYTRAVQCRECWASRGSQPIRKCQSCGKPMNRYAVLNTCKTCRTPEPTMCVDCGKPLPRRSQSPRCWECHTERRHVAAAQKFCTIEGCTQKHVAKGLCAVHYEWLRGNKSRQGKYVDPPARVWVANQPCQLCGYNRMRSHVHRPTAQGNYALGNMVALCARCHDEVHRGLTPCPPALTRT